MLCKYFEYISIYILPDKTLSTCTVSSKLNKQNSLIKFIRH